METPLPLTQCKDTDNEVDEMTLLLANPMAARRKRDNEKIAASVDGSTASKIAKMAALMRALMVRHERAAKSETVCVADPDAYCIFLERALTVIIQSYVDSHKLKQE